MPTSSSQPGGAMPVDAEADERAVYVAEGEASLDGLTLEPQRPLRAARPASRRPCARRRGAHVMLCGGAPLDGPRHVWWNFVSSSRERINQAKEDWRSGRFVAAAGRPRRVHPAARSAAEDGELSVRPFPGEDVIEVYVDESAGGGCAWSRWLGHDGKQRAMTEPTYQRVALATGVTLNVASAGPEDGEPIIFLHGFPESHRTWRHQLDGLADRLPGRSRPTSAASPPPTSREGVENYETDRIVADLMALADALGLDRLHPGRPRLGRRGRLAGGADPSRPGEAAGHRQRAPSARLPEEPDRRRGPARGLAIYQLLPLARGRGGDHRRWGSRPSSTR